MPGFASYAAQRRSNSTRCATGGGNASGCFNDPRISSARATRSVSESCSKFGISVARMRKNVAGAVGRQAHACRFYRCSKAAWVTSPLKAQLACRERYHRSGLPGGPFGTMPKKAITAEGRAGSSPGCEIRRHEKASERVFGGQTGGMDGLVYEHSSWPDTRLRARLRRAGPRERQTRSVSRGRVPSCDANGQQKTSEYRRLKWRDGRDSNPRPSA